ncbi:MAG TPA: PBP1A family penicillin-binding protein [Xanthobacteraceae bacterium]|nr:PBP1A family penicillin-binding protein [Xanthobacteraceae bacterium]
MFPDPGDDWQPKFRRVLLDLDARIDSAIFQAGKWARELYERFTAAMDGWHVAGWRRWILVEPLSEMATLGTGGLFLMLVLGIPAFRQTSDDDWLKKSDLAVTFLDRYGNEVGGRGIKHNESVPLDEFPDHLIKAVLATEDRRFYEHFGIDFQGTFRALMTNAQAGGVVQGGSTLTQQLAKNLFLSNERTIQRKINEAFLALWLESHLAKNEILKLYLDRAYLGGGAFGVDAAAEYYFGKSVRDVTLAEAAMLAGMFKAPTKFSPLVNLPAARARANIVLDNLVANGFMTEGQVYGARRNPATPIDRTAEAAPNYYLDFAFDEMRKIVDTFPKSVNDRYFVVRTALDSNLQRFAEHEIENELRQYGHDYGASQSAAVFADLDGGIRAMIGGRDYGASQFNRATDALRQPGSSFKPYVYATALANGFTPNSVVDGGPVCIGNWCPHNYSGGFSGPVTLIEAITHSINVIPVRLSIELGHGNPKLGRAMIVQTARNFGIHAPLPDTPSLPIGADEVYVYEHAVAYATFPNLGRAVAPHAALEVRTGTGQLVWRFDRDGPKPKQVISPQVALDMVKMMNSVVENGTGKRAQLDGIKVAGKTGTTNSWRDAWFVGYTGNYVGAVWMGNDDFSPTKRMTGGTLPAMTWHNIMAYAHQGIELRPLPGFPAPEHAPPMTDTSFVASDGPHPALLTRKGTDALIAVEHMLDDANQALTAQDAAGVSPVAPDAGKQGALGSPNAFATAADRVTAASSRGD